MTKGLVTNGGNDRLPKGNRPRRCFVDVTNRGLIPSATQAMIRLCNKKIPIRLLSPHSLALVNIADPSSAVNANLCGLQSQVAA